MISDPVAPAHGMASQTTADRTTVTSLGPANPNHNGHGGRSDVSDLGDLGDLNGNFNDAAGRPGPLPNWLVADLRTDHAGETGAVFIYRGMLATTRHAAVRHFAQTHLATEAAHLALIEPWLTPRQRSLLLPLWGVAGWLTGALPALLGPRAAYATVQAVETFVDQHYTEQIERIDRIHPAKASPALNEIRALLAACRADEIGHRDEAAELLAGHATPLSPALRLWVWSVGAGSRAAVKVCRRI